ncbi:MAG: hypothetical protein GF315_14245 [candidate division Zixibacteria bacterium]|nr:hypothetical protein [candidate division Zixibacteria bacterium]
MADCKNKTFNKMIHAYDLGLLSKKDEREFELHLMECDYCLEKVMEFRSEAHDLSNGTIIRQGVRELVRNEAEAIPLVTRIKELVFPKNRTWKIVSAMSVVILVLAFMVPIYQPAWDNSQVVVFRSLRSSGFEDDRTLHIGEGKLAEFVIAYMGFIDGNRVEIKIHSEPDGAEVFSTMEEVNKLRDSRGKVSVPMDIFNVGLYEFRIVDPESGEEVVSHKFRVVNDAD